MAAVEGLCSILRGRPLALPLSGRPLLRNKKTRQASISLFRSTSPWNSCGWPVPNLSRGHLMDIGRGRLTCSRRGGPTPQFQNLTKRSGLCPTCPMVRCRGTRVLGDRQALANRRGFNRASCVWLSRPSRRAVPALRTRFPQTTRTAAPQPPVVRAYCGSLPVPLQQLQL